MAVAFHPSHITLERFNTTCARYHDVVSEKLQDLDSVRYQTIPAAKSSSERPSLTKAELEKLVEWKLRHGKWRPKLQSLAASNPEAEVQSTTFKAASLLSALPDLPSSQDVSKALDTTCQLKGVGPATASLILSCFRPDCVPFFSDELYRWLCWDEPGSKGTSGWKRQIGYTKKEYATLIDRARTVLARLQTSDQLAGVDMLALEKVAYVLGKEEVDVDTVKGEEKTKGGSSKTSGAKSEQKAPEHGPGQAKGKKRAREPPAENGENKTESRPKRQRPTRTSTRKR